MLVTMKINDYTTQSYSHAQTRYFMCNHLENLGGSKKQNSAQGRGGQGDQLQQPRDFPRFVFRFIVQIKNLAFLYCSLNKTSLKTSAFKCYKKYKNIFTHIEKHL